MKTVVKLFLRLKLFLNGGKKIVDRLIELNAFHTGILVAFNNRKIELLKVHREEKDKEREKRLVWEINVLSEILGKERIDINNISATLNVHQNI